MAKNTFKQGQGTFVCVDCGKLTRNTGDNGQCQMCPHCYEVAGAVNCHSDHDHAGALADCKECLGYVSTKCDREACEACHKAEGGQ